MQVTHGGNIFALAESLGIPWREVLDFSASINPLGPVPALSQAILAAMDRIVHYPDPTSLELRKALSAHWDIPVEKILAGNGATELLFDWCRYFGSGAIATPAFGEFHRAWPSAKLFPLARREFWPAEGPVVFTRPANPTGTLIEAGQLLDYAKGREAPVLVDESFLPFTTDASLNSYAQGNLFILHSLTKFWALPGLRIGALVGDVSQLDGQRAPWSVNVMAEAAALASIADTEHALKTRKFIASESAWFAAQLSRLPGLEVAPPTANYLYVRTEDARALVHFAASRRTLIRDCSNWPGLGQPSFRAAVRLRPQNEKLLEILKEFLCASS